MARWTRDERLDQPQDFVRFMMEDYLNKGGFKKKIHKGEEVWQEGEGILSSARFIRYEYADGLFHLEAWIGKRRENALKGFVGALPKKMFRESLEELIRLLHQPLPQAREGEAGRVVTIQVPDHAKYAVPAMVVSIVGIIVGLMLSPWEESFLEAWGFRWDRMPGTPARATLQGLPSSWGQWPS